VGLCQIREKRHFDGLPVQERCSKLLCGVAVVDLRTGAQCGLLEFTGGCQELYDVAVIPDVSRPMILNAEAEEVARAVVIPEGGFWLENDKK